MAKNKKEKKKVAKEESEENVATSLNDAFADDNDVEYAKAKPKKEKKDKKGKKGKNDGLEKELEEAEEEVEKIEKAVNSGEGISDVSIKASKPITKIKKGDKIEVDGKEYEVDQHYVLIDHGITKEMAIELFDKDDKDYQIRYFNDQIETTIEFYELQEIMFIKKRISKVEW